MSNSVVTSWSAALALCSALTLPGCVAPVGVSSLSVPPDAAATCASHCEGIGMRLSAVAIMADNVGCVCEPKSEAGSARADTGRAGRTSSPAAGMATLVMQEEQEERRRSSQSPTLSGTKY